MRRRTAVGDTARLAHSMLRVPRGASRHLTASHDRCWCGHDMARPHGSMPSRPQVHVQRWPLAGEQEELILEIWVRCSCTSRRATIASPFFDQGSLCDKMARCTAPAPRGAWRVPDFSRRSRRRLGILGSLGRFQGALATPDPRSSGLSLKTKYTLRRHVGEPCARRQRLV